ncbi:hypothetical protein ABTM48_20885, partial [Acinetobacter baumannii]
MIITATYSPEDNKLRMYASARLDARHTPASKTPVSSGHPSKTCSLRPCGRLPVKTSALNSRERS